MAPAAAARVASLNGSAQLNVLTDWLSSVVNASTLVCVCVNQFHSEQSHTLKLCRAGLGGAGPAGAAVRGNGALWVHSAWVKRSADFSSRLITWKSARQSSICGRRPLWQPDALWGIWLWGASAQSKQMNLWLLTFHSRRAGVIVPLWGPRPPRWAPICAPQRGNKWPDPPSTGGGGP